MIEYRQLSSEDDFRLRSVSNNAVANDAAQCRPSLPTASTRSPALFDAEARQAYSSTSLHHRILPMSSVTNRARAAELMPNR